MEGLTFIVFEFMILCVFSSMCFDAIYTASFMLTFLLDWVMQTLGYLA